ncbi:right-handed parallel beta-helix repeat-containing protein, partial [Candidatus Woesearchaeota archaeon]|nr:right-handed parallel beta-helix repeat-containing protein [Candidatus Woesearchaeota archaeon]
MDDRLLTPWKEYLVFALIFGLALLWATQVDTITGMASSTTGTNTSLGIFSDTDTMNRSQGELVHFYANYTNLTGWPIDNATGNGSCFIQFSDSPAVFNMSFNISGTDVYGYTRTFPTPATYNWNVTCISDSYETLALSDTAVIKVTYCGHNVSGSISLSQDLEMENGSTSCSESGLAIDGSDLVLDCAGHSISGIGNSSGISLLAADNVTVVNCTIEGFKQGISIDAASSGNLFHHNTFISNAIHAYSDNPANQFNITSAGKAIGNSWDDVAKLAIFDSDSDGYGDFGQQYPYSGANSGLVSGNVTDYGPVSSRLDSDDDGSPDTEDCAPSDPSVMAPRDDLLITRDSTLCPGTYHVNDSWYSGVIRFNASNVTLDCAGSVLLVGNGTGTGIYVGVANNTVTDCNVSGYYDGVVVSDVNSTNLSGAYSYGNEATGIKLSNASRSVIDGPEVFNNSNAGLFLTIYSVDNVLTGISAYDNYIG